MKTENRGFCRRLTALLLTVLMIFASGASAEEGEGYEVYEDEDGQWYSVHVSEPDGNGGGKSILLEYDAALKLPEKGEYRWYTCDETGENRELVAVTTDCRFETEPFEQPEVRYYLCELTADGERFEDELFAAGFTGLPVIRIHTEEEEDIVYDDYYLSGSMTVQDGETVKELPIRIKGRGNATFNYPKKPFTVKLESKTGLLGMEKSKKWVLLAGYCDKSLLRAALGFKVSELVGLAYTPEYRYVDLVVNGAYAGNYILCEPVKEEAKRLDFSGDGFLVEETQYDGDEDPAFYTEKRGLRFRFRYPDKEKVTAEILDQVTAEINELEQAILNLDGTDAELPEAVDTDSWVNWLLVQNILDNKDTNRYYYRTGSGAKICMGPAWDFEWSVGIGWYYGERPNPNHELIVKTVYLQKLMENGQFRQNLKERWKEVSPGLAEILTGFVNDTAREIAFSRQLNFHRWRVMNIRLAAGGIPLGSYEAELECDRTYLLEHIRWLDEQIGGM